MYEYDDFNDTANMSDYMYNNTATHKHPLTDLNWVIISHKGDDSYQTLVVNATKPHSHSNQSHELFKENGYLSFRVCIRCSNIYSCSRLKCLHCFWCVFAKVVQYFLTELYTGTLLELILQIFFNSAKSAVFCSANYLAEIWNMTKT